MRARRATQRSGGRAGRALGRGWRGLSVLSGALLSALAAALAVVLLALARGPISAPALIGPMQAVAARSLPGARAEIERVELALWRQGRLAPRLRLIGARLFDETGAEAFRAESLRLSFDLWSALHGRARPSELVMDAPRLALIRDPSGVVSARLEGAGGGEAALPPALLEGRLTMCDAALTLIDESRDASLTLAPVAMSLQSRDGRIEATLDARLDDAAAIRAALDWKEGAGGTLTLAAPSLSAAALAGYARELKPLAMLDAALGVDLRVDLDGGGEPVAARGRLRAGPGGVALGDRPERFERVEAVFDYDVATRRIAIESAEIVAQRLATEATGAVVLAPDFASATLDLAFAGLRLDAPELFPEPASFERAHLVARLSPARAEIAALTLARGAMTLNLDGRFDAPDWTGVARLNGRGVSAADIRALWPIGAAKGARAWVRENLAEATVPRFDLWARTGPEEGIALSVAFEQGLAHYLRPMPPLEDASGWAAVDLRRFGLGLTAGAVRPEGAGAASLAGSTMRLPDFDDPLSTAYLALRGRGPIRAFLAALDGDPLNLVSRVGLDPRAVAGAAAARAEMTLPLLKDLRLEQVSVGARATLSDVALTAPGTGRPVASERLALAVDMAGLTLEGATVVDGVPMQTRLEERFAPAADAPRQRLALSGRFDRAALARFGLDPGDALSGKVDIAATLSRFDNGATGFEARADLARAGLDLAALDWRKRRGDAATARAQGRLGPDGAARFERLALDAPGLTLSGAARLDAAGGLSSLRLERFRLDRRAALSLSLQREADGWRAELAGEKLDFDLFRHARDDGDGAGERIDFTAEIGALAVSEGVSLGAVSASGRWPGGPVSAAGRLGAARLDAALGGDGGLLVAVDDLGAALDAAGAFSDAYGGAATLTGRLEGADPLAFRGRVEGTGLKLAQSAALAQRVTDAAPEQAAAILQAEGVHLDRFSGDIALENGALAFESVRASGGTIGLTAEGRYDLDKDWLEMRGVFTPVFGLNSALGGIPLIGDLLTGGEGRGVFALNYKVSGPGGDPSLSFNPLSGLAPGVLRELFQPF